MYLYPQPIDTTEHSEFAVSRQQLAAVAKPRSKTKSLLAKRRLSANARARLVNDFLADPKAD